MAKREIKFSVELDAQNNPQSIEWEATDAGFDGAQACSSMMINLWDPAAQNTMNIHLWTPGMLVNDMNAHYFQSLMAMADSYQNATRNSELAGMIREFAKSFLDKVREKQDG